MRKNDIKAVERHSRLNKSEKARLLIKSKKNSAWKNYAPPEHQPAYIPVLPNSTVARKAKADHSPERRGRKREISSSYYSCSSRDLVV